MRSPMIQSGCYPVGERERQAEGVGDGHTTQCKDDPIGKLEGVTVVENRSEHSTCGEFNSGEPNNSEDNCP